MTHYGLQSDNADGDGNEENEEVAVGLQLFGVEPPAQPTLGTQQNGTIHVDPDNPPETNGATVGPRQNRLSHAQMGAWQERRPAQVERADHNGREREREREAARRERTAELCTMLREYQDRAAARAAANAAREQLVHDRRLAELRPVGHLAATEEEIEEDRGNAEDRAVALRGAAEASGQPKRNVGRPKKGQEVAAPRRIAAEEDAGEPEDPVFSRSGRRVKQKRIIDMVIEDPRQPQRPRAEQAREMSRGGVAGDGAAGM